MLRPATPEERARGLEAAARARALRASLLRRLKAAEITLTDVWAEVDQDPGDYVGRTRVRLIVKALPGIGSVTTRRILDTIGLDGDRRLAKLGSQQRTVLTRETATTRH